MLIGEIPLRTVIRAEPQFVGETIIIIQKERQGRRGAEFLLGAARPSLFFVFREKGVNKNE